jgi:hypothetical protein
MPVGGYATTNGLAIASLVCSFFFWILGVPSLLAIVFGLVARAQIGKSGGTQKGGGLAMAGIIIGVIGVALTVLWFVFVVFARGPSCASNGGTYC